MDGLPIFVYIVAGDSVKALMAHRLLFLLLPRYSLGLGL